MNAGAIHAVCVPKWGITMEQGTVVEWYVNEGDEVDVGDELLDLETTKAASAVEAPQAGVLRRRIANIGDAVPVGALLAVIADAAISDADIDAFIDDQRIEPVEDVSGADTVQPEVVTTADGRGLRYLRQGSGNTPALLLHGWGGDLEDWALNQSTLAGERAVFAVDLPGHGGSSKDVGDGSASEAAAAIRAFMEATDLSRVHLVGHSFGGAVAIELALAAPERVASLALIAPVGLGTEIDGATLAGFVGADRRRELMPYLQAMYGEDARITRAAAEATLRKLRIDGVREAMERIRAGSFPNDHQARVFGAELDMLAMPVLVVWGAADRIIPPAHAHAIADAETLLLDGIGHSPMLEAAARVNDALGRHWLRAE